MKHLLFLVFSLLLVGCSNNVSNPQEISSKDSLGTEKETIEEPESRGKQFTTEELDSLALIAWGDVKFGISQKQAWKSIVFKNGYDNHDGSIESYFEYDINLHNALHLSNAIKVMAEFEGKGYSTLYRTRVYITPCVNYDDFLHDVEIMMLKFSESYGKPTYFNEHSLLKYELSNKIVKAAYWKIESPNHGTKRIEMYVEYNGKYEVFFYISNLKYRDSSKEAIEKSKKEKAAQDEALKAAF